MARHKAGHDEVAAAINAQAGSISICDSVSSELPGRFATRTDQ